MTRRAFSFDLNRITLPPDLMPNKEVELDAKVTAPNKPGNYILEFDMVQEKVSWFKDLQVVAFFS